MQKETTEKYLLISLERYTYNHFISLATIPKLKTIFSFFFKKKVQVEFGSNELASKHNHFNLKHVCNKWKTYFVINLIFLHFIKKNKFQSSNGLHDGEHQILKIHISCTQH